MARRNGKAYSKRGIIIIIILLLALVALAVPLVSSLEALPDYIDIGADILSIPDIVSGNLSFSTITDNWPIIVLIFFMLFSLLLVLKTLLALISKKKRKYFVITFITLLLSLAFILSTYNFSFSALMDDLSNLGTFLGNLDYGVYAMVGSPLLILILSAFGYKKKLAA